MNCTILAVFTLIDALINLIHNSNIQIGRLQKTHIYVSEDAYIRQLIELSTIYAMAWHQTADRP